MRSGTQPGIDWSLTSMLILLVGAIAVLSVPLT
jgi:hypothetical protein